MYRPPNDGRWHCRVLACTAVYATQPELERHVAKRHTYLSHPTVTHATSIAETTQPIHQRSTSTSSMQPPIQSPNTPSPQMSVVPSVRAAERYLPRNGMQKAGQTPFVEATTARPEHLQTITYEAPSHMNHSNLTHPLDSQQDNVRRRTMYMALRDVNAWPQEAIDTLKGVVRQNLKPLLSISDNQNFIMATMFSIFKNKLTKWYQLVLEDDGRLYPIFLNKTKQMLQVANENTTSGTTHSSSIDNNRLLGEQAIFPASHPNITALQTSTPPQTPIIAGGETDALSLYWASTTAQKQAALFRELLRTAKDPQGLKREWEDHCSSTQKETGKERSDRLPVPVTVEQTQGATPIYTPPTDSRTDLDAMIEARIQNARLKRKREEDAKNLQVAKSSDHTGGENCFKRPKEEPIVLSP